MELSLKTWNRSYNSIKQSAWKGCDNGATKKKRSIDYRSITIPTGQ